MRIEFFMPMIPPTATYQEKRVVIKNGKRCSFDSDDLKAARNKLQAHLGQHFQREPETFIKPVRLITKWCFPISGKHKNGEYKATKPDTDNLQKLLKDIMTDVGFWKDDALVCSEIIEKFWADNPGIYICIEELN